MSRVTAIISALVICIIVCLSWAVNHYRDNAIAYKEQRDKAASIIADMQKRQRDVAELDARYTKELADANATIQTVCLLVAVISWRSGTVGITSTERNLAITGANKCRFSNFRL